jgi:hypothetical protein
MNYRILVKVVTITLLISACQVTAAPPTPMPTPTPQPSPLPPTSTPVPETPTPTPPPPTPTPTEIPVGTPTPTPEPDPRPEEAILILEPGPGSQVSSPVRIAGIADPAFEQTLVVRIVLADGTELEEIPTMIQAELGGRGPFELEYPFTATGQAFIQVYDLSAAVPGIVHLSSVGVTLQPNGPQDIRPVEPQPEQIAIFQPQNGDTIQGGFLTVEGYGLASFEQTLVVEVIDQNGEVVGMEVVTLASELGEPGPFSTQVTYSVDAPGPALVSVRDISPAFGGDVHVNSVHVDLHP